MMDLQKPAIHITGNRCLPTHEFVVPFDPGFDVHVNRPPLSLGPDVFHYLDMKPLIVVSGRLESHVVPYHPS